MLRPCEALSEYSADYIGELMDGLNLHRMNDNITFICKYNNTNRLNMFTIRKAGEQEYDWTLDGHLLRRASMRDIASEVSSEVARWMNEPNCTEVRLVYVLYGALSVSIVFDCERTERRNRMRRATANEEADAAPPRRTAVNGGAENAGQGSQDPMQAFMNRRTQRVPNYTINHYENQYQPSLFETSKKPSLSRRLFGTAKYTGCMIPRICISGSTFMKKPCPH